MVDDKNNVVINSPETIAALEYAKQLYATYHRRRAVVARSEQQQGVPRRPDQPDLQRHIDLHRRQELARSGAEGDRRGHGPRQHADRPGRASRPSSRTSSTPTLTPTPNTRTQCANICASCGRSSRSTLGRRLERLYRAAAAGLERQSDLDRRSKVTPFRDVLKYALDNGYSGALGYASAAVMGDFVVVDMFAEACTGEQDARRPPRTRRRAGEALLQALDAKRGERDGAMRARRMRRDYSP